MHGKQLLVHVPAVLDVACRAGDDCGEEWQEDGVHYRHLEEDGDELVRLLDGLGDDDRDPEELEGEKHGG